MRRSFSRPTRTVENVRRAYALEGFERALVRKKPATSPTPKLLDGAAIARVIAMRSGEPPAGFGHWTLRLLADQMVGLEVVESISPETDRQALKRTTARVVCLAGTAASQHRVAFNRAVVILSPPVGGWDQDP
ncbi:MAG: helix-turn-helix domain-containing protein [Gemmataceae bacterium]